MKIRASNPLPHSTIPHNTMATAAEPQSTMATTAEEFEGARAEITAKIAVVEGRLEALRDVPIGRRDWAVIQTADQSRAALVKELGTIEAQQAGSEPAAAMEASGPGAGPEGEPPQPLLRVTTVTGFGDTSKADLVDKIVAGGGGARTAVVVAQHLPDGAAPSPDPADQERGRCYSRGGQVRAAHTSARSNASPPDARLLFPMLTRLLKPNPFLQPPAPYTSLSLSISPAVVTAQMVTRPEQPRQPTSQDEADEMTQDALMGGVPLRIDLLEELCRIAASGDYDTVILQVCEAAKTARPPARAPLVPRPSAGCTRSLRAHSGSSAMRGCTVHASLAVHRLLARPADVTRPRCHRPPARCFAHPGGSSVRPRATRARWRPRSIPRSPRGFSTSMCPTPKTRSPGSVAQSTC